jgi:NADP-dependent 3-hydroxy acid dehydrogenase YdfG
VRVTLLKPGIVESEFQGVAGYTAENFFKGVEKFGTLLKPEDVARAVVFLAAQPAGVHVCELVIRPTGQDYP